MVNLWRANKQYAPPRGASNGIAAMQRMRQLAARNGTGVEACKAKAKPPRLKWAAPNKEAAMYDDEFEDGNRVLAAHVRLMAWLCVTGLIGFIATMVLL